MRRLVGGDWGMMMMTMMMIMIIRMIAIMLLVLLLVLAFLVKNVNFNIKNNPVIKLHFYQRNNMIFSKD